MMFKKLLSLGMVITFQAHYVVSTIHIKSSKQLAENFNYSLYGESEFPLNAHVITVPCNAIDIKLGSVEFLKE